MEQKVLELSPLGHFIFSMDLSLPGMKSPRGEKSCIPGTYNSISRSRYQEYSFPRLFVPWNIRSHDGTFVLGTIRSLEHSFPGPFVPWNFRSRHPGPFLPRTVCAFVSREVPVLEQRNKQKRSPMTATVHSRYKFTAAVHC